MNYHKLYHDKITQLMELDDRPRKVYLVLCKYADFDTGIAYPGYTRLKKECRITSGRDIKKAIDSLLEAGLIATWMDGHKRHYQVL